MLTQGKRKRTVEDFNQFCTFVLAYAGYIPYPTEEWQCNDSVLRDSSTCSPHHSEDWASFSSPQSYYGPAQSKRGPGATSEEKFGKKSNKEKKKRRKEKGSNKKTVPPKPQFEMIKGASISSSFSTADASSVLDCNHGCKTTAQTQPRPEDAADLFRGIYRPSVLKDEPQEYTASVDWDSGDRAALTGPGRLKNIPKDYLSCDDIPVPPNSDLIERRPSVSHGVKAEPGDLTAVSLTGQLRKAAAILQEGEEPDRRTAEDGRGGADAEEEAGEESEGGPVGGEAWEDGEGGAADILRLVMERRLTGRVADDQETGYHTDRASSTAEQGGSDTDQDARAADCCNTTASSAYGTEDTSAENSKLEEEEDSWDLITCFCMKPFAGRPMIECSECATWVHLSCAKIRRTHVPDVFVCQPCRDAKQGIRRSSRARTVSRKCFGD